MGGEDCELCDEVQLAGTAVTGRGGAVDEPFSRLIRRTSVVDVIAGLGCITPGYVLLVPRTHLRSVGELPRHDVARLFDVAWRTARDIQRDFGGDVVLFEHGSSGGTDTGGACVAHAHLHLFPVPATVNLSDFLPPGATEIHGVDRLHDAAAERRSYNYCASSVNAGKGYFALDPHNQSQFARRAWAATLGSPDTWDWAAFPYMANTRITADRLSSSYAQSVELAEDSQLAETIGAYDDAAVAYSERTREFRGSSSLQKEMVWLLGQTTGRVLDAGAGAGRDSAFMARQGREVVGLDASRVLLSTWRETDRCPRIIGDVRHLPFRDESFGAIWCSAVLLHLGSRDVRQAFLEFWRVLQPDGIAQVSVKEGRGHISSPLSGGGRRRHFFFYEVDELADTADRAGFEVVRSWTEDEADSAEVVQRWVKLLVRKSSR